MWGCGFHTKYNSRFIHKVSDYFIVSKEEKYTTDLYMFNKTSYKINKYAEQLHWYWCIFSPKGYKTSLKVNCSCTNQAQVCTDVHLSSLHFIRTTIPCSSVLRGKFKKSMNIFHHLQTSAMLAAAVEYPQHTFTWLLTLHLWSPINSPWSVAWAYVIYVSIHMHTCTHHIWFVCLFVSVCLRKRIWTYTVHITI